VWVLVLGLALGDTDAARARLLGGVEQRAAAIVVVVGGVMSLQTVWDVATVLVFGLAAVAFWLAYQRRPR
jgi:hypothetical protein